MNDVWFDVDLAKTIETDLVEVNDVIANLPNLAGFGATENAKVFGYQERYAEYRYKPSTIVGKLRSNAGGSLDAWHLSQFFSSAPTLSVLIYRTFVPALSATTFQLGPNNCFSAGTATTLSNGGWS
jgi:hypothetical protein